MMFSAYFSESKHTGLVQSSGRNQAKCYSRTRSFGQQRHKSWFPSNADTKDLLNTARARDHSDPHGSRSYYDAKVAERKGECSLIATVFHRRSFVTKSGIP